MNHSKSRTDIPLLFKRLPWRIPLQTLTPHDECLAPAAGGGDGNQDPDHPGLLA
jgi:hypothetical protein